MILSSFCTNDGNDGFTESAQPAVCFLSRVIKGFFFGFLFFFRLSGDCSDHTHWTEGSVVN